MIYLDNSATTVVREEVRQAMMPFLREQGGNPSSLHALGRPARAAVDKAREQVAKLLNCQPSEIYFSPCATYSNNAAILGRAKYADRSGQGRHLITSAIEHPSCLGPAKYLESNGWRVTYLRPDKDGLISVSQLEQSITKDTSLISFAFANNEIGSILPIAELSALAKERGIYFHTDAVQMPGKLPIDVAALSVDCLSLSGHKFYAPKGIGVLYKRDGVELDPLVFGGGQEAGQFPGTESVANIAAIGEAAEHARLELADTELSLRAMQKIISDELLSIDGVRITGPVDVTKRLPGHISVVIPGVEGEAIVMRCDLKGLCISSAAACHKGEKEPSHVITALGIPADLAMGSIRVSAGRFNTQDECAKAMDIIKQAVAAIRKTGARVS